MTARAQQIGDVADEMLEKLLLSERCNDAQSRLHAGHATQAYRRLWSADYHLIDPIIEGDDAVGEWYLVQSRNEPEPIFWPVDCGAAVRQPEHDQFIRVQTVGPNEIRGLTRIVPPRCVIVSSWHIHPDRTWWAESAVCGQLGGEWLPIDRKIRKTRISSIDGREVLLCIDTTKKRTEDYSKSVDLSLAVRLTARYDWHVALGFNDTGPRLLIPTSARGCLDLFKSRDRAPGERRRAALRHWVSNHFRRRNAGPDTDSYVRDHLRGNTRFIWNGLDCELQVSEYDLEKNDLYRSQAAAWRSMRRRK